MSIMTQPAAASGNRSADGRVKPRRRRRIVAMIILSVVCTGLILQGIIWAGYLAQSTAILVIAILLAVIGISAGATAAELRKKSKIDDAVFAYRIAVWCLFLA